MRFGQSLVVCDIGLNGRTGTTEPSLIMCNNNIAIPFVSGRRLLSFHRMHMYFTASMTTASASLSYTTGSVCALSASPLILHPYSCFHCTIIFVVELLWNVTVFQSMSNVCEHRLWLCISLLDQQIYMWYRNIIFVYIFLYNSLDFCLSFCFLSFLIPFCFAFHR